MSLEERVALVIGGGNGIGAACCRLLAEQGWRLAVADLSGAAADAVAREVSGQAYAIDIAELAAVERLRDAVEQRQGSVRGLVVAAAAFQDKYPPDAFPMDLWRHIVRVNFEGTFNANRVFAARMAQQGGGTIVNVASIVGHASSPQHAYGPTKAAVLGITRNFAAQYGRSGVRVNSVSPGAVLVERVLARPPGRYASDIDAQMALGRRVQPNEVAEGIAFLLSDRASAITGTDLLIDAGWAVANAWHIYGGIPGPASD